MNSASLPLKPALKSSSQNVEGLQPESQHSNIDHSESLIEKLLDKNAVDIQYMHKLATLLNAGIDKRTIAILHELINLNIDPESLSDSKFYLSIFPLNVSFVFLNTVVILEMKSSIK